MSKKATAEALEALHGALAEAFAQYLEGLKAGAEPNASVLKEIRTFLHDNGIEQTMTPTNNIGRLMGMLNEADKLPFPGEPSHH